MATALAAPPTENGGTCHGGEGDAGKHAVRQCFAEKGHAPDDDPGAYDRAQHGHERTADERAQQERVLERQEKGHDT